MLVPSQPSPTQTRLGNLTVTTLSDGFLDVPGAYFSNLSPQEHRHVLPTARFGANTWLIEAEARKVLVDAGSGSWLKERFADTGNLGWQLDDRMEERAAVTDIIVTHMHADHIGGLVAGGRSLFPNATIHMQAAEWVFWTDAALPQSVPEDQRPLIELIQALGTPLKGQIKLHEGEADLGGGITLLPAAGHTPGHQVVHLSAGTRELMLIADAVVSEALQFGNPDIHYALDGDPAKAAETRKTLFDRFASNKIPFAATHLTSTGFGHLERSGSGYDYTAA
ncbi:MBL fold metallo-hydrolase [Labrenzia sp. VG12]|uniref:MBL fold metallo-hydrolase n=1 Tax=Labrenzia sp. VG12 TaxID=2021862 RepID=UPI000B8BD0DB|nr:MBL fold metallo-hydrolase [Labrenzia sp. VG12]ASP34780.1 MBL fold metallo-hydrolase [Labrenzia sp. VG12]